MKTKKLKEHRTELKERGCAFCNCKAGDHMVEIIIKLSTKIASQIDVSDQGNKKEQNEYLHNLILDISCSILNKSYLMNLGEWKEEEDGRCTLLLDESEHFHLVHMLMVTYFDEHPLTIHESEYFGEYINKARQWFLKDEQIVQAA